MAGVVGVAGGFTGLAIATVFAVALADDVEVVGAGGDGDTGEQGGTRR